MDTPLEMFELSPTSNHSETFQLGHYEIEVLPGADQILSLLKRGRSRRHAGHHAHIDYDLLVDVVSKTKVLENATTYPDHSVIAASPDQILLGKAHNTPALIMRGHTSYFIGRDFSTIATCSQFIIFPFKKLPTVNVPPSV